ncbi:nuclease-related domain-containing protein [Salimicrobium flavidum]|uniref:Nuclease-related domain-containing protein n=1 Tax=Salimicrobium flavidum TaxID=570947 RepID=A0A1N7J0Q5_9BACI|nr:nuclease-related domain-containing protein [Salimicrobium flavidum]SIS42948.1 Nuclease-related domain-containing protein [Salimicrobium flavidum]
MIVKPPEPPFLDAWRALHARAHMPLSDEVDQMISRMVSGFQGEQSLAYPLSLLPSDFDIYYGLRLPSIESFFQIDCLIVHENFLAILEVKNHRGTLLFDTARAQLLREWEGKTETFPDPVLQARRQRMQLLEFLGDPSLPCEALVIAANRKARIAGDLPPDVLRPDMIPFYIDSLMYDSPLIDKTFLRKKLLQAHCPAETDVLKRMGVNAADVLPGVRCKDCGRLSMQRVRTVWHCVCGAREKRAHLSTLEDYRLLFGERITNRQARWFLQMQDSRAVHHILKKNTVRSEGPNKKKVYFLR